MDTPRFRPSDRAKYIALYIACVLICFLNVLLTGDAYRILIILSIAYGIVSYIMTGSCWKPNLPFFLFNMVCALLVKWYDVEQNIAFILAEPIISLLFSVCTRTILQGFCSAPHPEKECDRKPSWFQNNRIGFALIFSSNLIYFILVSADILLFKCQSGLMFFYIFLIYPCAGSLLGIFSCLKTSKFAGICAIFLGISVHVATFSWLIFVYINEYYLYVVIFVAAFVILGYLLGMISGLITKIFVRNRWIEYGVQ